MFSLTILNFYINYHIDQTVINFSLIINNFFISFNEIIIPSQNPLYYNHVCRSKTQITQTLFFHEPVERKQFLSTFCFSVKLLT